MNKPRLPFIPLILIAMIAGLGAVPQVATAETLVILVRHAEKASKDRDAGLTPAGLDRAGALANALSDTPLDRIVVTAYPRTQLTAAPVAEAHGITPVVIPSGGTLEEHIEAVAAAVRAEPPVRAVLVVGHSNTVCRIVAALGGPKLDDLLDAEHSPMFILDIPTQGEPRLVKAKYGALDPYE